MSRKHFEAIAAILHAELVVSPTEAEYNRVRGIILSLADKFAGFNVNFNREIFYKACGLTKDGFPA
jgi:hypothetical protein